MRIVIMADGRGTRWNNYMGVPKHLIEVDGEPIIARTVRLLNQLTEGADIVVTSHDARYEFDGARRYEPLNNHYEIDRFTEELIQDDMCFLYGDTIYSEDALKQIIETPVDDVLFYGNNKSVVAVRIADADVFRTHFMKVRQLYIDGKIEKCKGWQVYQSVVGQPLDKKPVPGDKFITVSENTTDINTPEEYREKARKDL